MVKFRGYNDSHNEWVRHDRVFSPELVADYYRRYPNAPRHIAYASFDSFPFRSSDLVPSSPIPPMR